MPVVIALIVLVLIILDFRRPYGMPLSELYRQKFMKDC